MDAAQRKQPILNRFAGLIHGFGRLQALRSDCLDGGERILDPVVQFFHQQPLQPLSHFMLGRIDACLLQQAPQIDVFGFEVEFFLVHRRAPPHNVSDAERQQAARASRALFPNGHDSTTLANDHAPRDGWNFSPVLRL